MAYFPDLSPYTYGNCDHPNAVHVGWLDDTHEFPKGPVAPHLVEKLKRLALHPVEIYRGHHVCELCIAPGPSIIDGTLSKSWSDWAKLRSSNGEIRITVRSMGDAAPNETSVSSRPSLATESILIDFKQLTYAAPVLIVHYIEAHNYLPPGEFLKALEDVPE
jgi:hypothetical protein